MPLTNAELQAARELADQYHCEDCTPGGAQQLAVLVEQLLDEIEAMRPVAEEAER